MRFSDVTCLGRGAPPRRLPAADLNPTVLERLVAPRADIAGLSLAAPRVMAILNTTPDSFSDGGLFHSAEAAFAHAQHLSEAGADILDIGGESTRPGAVEVSLDEEISRTVPVIEALRGAGLDTPISIDTRKSAVAAAALTAGADLINDVSAFSFDPAMADLAITRQVPCCLMHAQGNPDVMQADPRYADVVLDIYDYLEAKVARLEARGLSRAAILVDTGIGFGKTVAHNLALLRNLSLFHGIGCGILLGASRKSFIGALTGTPDAATRMPGSVAAALHGVAQGVQVLRVHDVEDTRQALTVWSHVTGKETP